MNCKVMGIVNVTPDSFSDGGKFFSPEEALRRARNLIAEGAAMIDLGGESTRPGATPLTWQEEWARLEPVVGPLAQEIPENVLLSIDTYHPETAERALAAGAKMINCVAVETTRAMFELAAKAGAEVVFPVKALPTLPNALLDAVPHYLDPMIGFGTTREEDLALLRGIGDLARQGRVLIGASRKRIIKKLTGEKAPGKDLAGNLALVLYVAQAGASAVRVHDVRETVQALKTWNSLQ